MKRKAKPLSLEKFLPLKNPFFLLFYRVFSVTLPKMSLAVVLAELGVCMRCSLRLSGCHTLAVYDSLDEEKVSVHLLQTARLGLACLFALFRRYKYPWL